MRPEHAPRRATKVEMGRQTHRADDTGLERIPTELIGNNEDVRGFVWRPRFLLTQITTEIGASTRPEDFIVEIGGANCLSQTPHNRASSEIGSSLQNQSSPGHVPFG